MNIIFDKLKIHNFLSITDADIELQNKGYVLVSGENHNIVDASSSNGSGKSSIFDAIVWCITGNTSRGNADDIVTIGAEDGCFVRLSLQIGKEEYVILRSRNHKLYKTNLRFWVNGEDKSGKGIRDSEKLVKETLPWIYSGTLESLIILGQGLPNKFSGNTATIRKEILESLSQTESAVVDLKQKVSCRQSKIQSEISEIDKALLTEELNCENIKKEIDSCYTQLQNKSSIEELKEKENSLISQLEFVDNIINGLQEEITKISSENLSHQIDSLNLEFREEESKINAAHKEQLEEIKERKSKIEHEISSLNQYINKINNIVDICPTCGQKIVGIEKPTTDKEEQQVKKLYKELDETINLYKTIDSKRNYEIEQVFKNIQSQIDILKKKKASIEAEQSSKQAQLNENQLSKSNIQKSLDNIKTEITQIDSITTYLKTKIAEEQAKLPKIKEKIIYNNKEKEVLNGRLQIVTKISSLLNKDFRSYLLSDTVKYIDSRCKKYSNIVFGNEELRFYIDNNAVLISYAGKQYEALSGGEKQKVDIIVQLSMRDMLALYTDFSSNILVVDEIFDNLDTKSCNAIINLLNSSLLNFDSIFVITHHTDIDIPYDSTIKVIKDTNGVSTVIQN